MATTAEQKINTALERYEREQREFENHPLWRDLGTTPQEFFKKIHDVVKKNGISAQAWQQKLNEARQTLETRLRENRGQYTKFNLNQLQGLKA